MFASGAQGRHDDKCDQAAEQIQATAFSSDVQLLKNVLGVNAACAELCSMSGQQAQQPLTALVDERDFIEVNDTSASRVRAMPFLPARPELLGPRMGKPAMQNPSLLSRGFTESDFQHTFFLGACGENEFLRLQARLHWHAGHFYFCLPSFILLHFS